MTARIGFLIAALVAVCPASAQSQDITDTQRLSGGAISDALVAGPSSQSMESSTTTFAKLVSFHINLDDRQSVGVSTEFLKLASFYFKMRGYEEQPDWKFKAVPITFGYERLLCDADRRIVPVVGVGISYYLTQVKTRMPESLTGPVLPTTPTSAYVKRSYGMGFGAQATAGIRAKLTHRTFLQLQARYRLVNGLGVTSDDFSAGEFGVFDFAVGIGFSI